LLKRLFSKTGSEEKAVRKEALRKAQEESRQIQEALKESQADLYARPSELTRDLETRQEDAEGLANKVSQGIAKTRRKLSEGLARLLLGRKELDPEVLEELEEVLLSSDLGPHTTTRLIRAVEERVRRAELKDPVRLKSVLREEIGRVLSREFPPLRLEAHPPVIVLFAGVNGSGKTTTIGKLGTLFTRQGRKVLLVAGDTFRAAAAEQLQTWAERSGCDLFRAEEGANPSGVIYQAVEKALREGHDLVLCDTAGRLHTKSNLMEELKKIKRVIGKLIPEAPQETLLVLDANNGQNAIHQTRDFHAAVGLTGLIITKLDGTARGGVIVGIVNEFELPVRYIGVGEGIDDLRPFDPMAFADSLFG